jgi:nucleoside-diphosphate-sugar epimerase
MMPPKAMLTGATGFIGSHLLQTLVAKKWSVTCLVRPQSRIGELKKMPVRIIRGRLNDPDLLKHAVKDQDYIFHLAARIRPAPAEVYENVNHLWTRDLAIACLHANPGVKRFIYVSSMGAAGPTPADIYYDESRSPSPQSEYGRTKLRGEKAIRELWRNIPATIIRPPNVFGARQQETGLLIKLLRARIVPLLKEEGKSTSLIYIKDLIRGILQASESPQSQGQIYYLTDGSGYSWREIILALKRAVLGDSLFLPVPEEFIYSLAWFADLIRSLGFRKLYFGRRIWDTMVKTHWLYSSAKAARDLGFHPEFNLISGIRDMLGSA